MLRVEYADETDSPRLLEIRYSAFSAYAPAAYSETEVATLLDDVDEGELREMIGQDQLFVAIATTGTPGRGITGLAGWTGRRLRHVYVDPGHTRQGIGTALLRRVEADFARRTGAREITAGVALHAEPFYVANGYTLVRRAIAWDGSEYLEMAKPLG
jgi:GNAT superfamily N-acetyltransferase